MPPSGGKAIADSSSRAASRNTPAFPAEVRKVVEEEYRAACLKHAATRLRKIRENVARAGRIDDSSDDDEDTVPGNEHNGVGVREMSEGVCRARRALKDIPRVENTVRMKVSATPPPGLAWVRLKSNMLVPQEYKHEFFVPYLGESDKHLESSNTLAMALFSDDESVDGNDSEVEEDPWVPDEREEVVEVERAEKRMGLRARKDGGALPVVVKRGRLKFSPTMWDRAIKRVALKAIVEKLGCNNVTQIADAVCEVFKIRSHKHVAHYYTNVTTREKIWAVKDADERKEQMQSDEVLAAARIETPVRAAEALQGNSIAFFGCRQCYMYLCEMHGYPPDVPAAPPVIRPVDKTKKHLATSEVAEKLESRCEHAADGACWYKSADGTSEAKWVATLRGDKEAWKDVEAVLKESSKTFGSKDPCRVSALVKTVLHGVHSTFKFTCRRIGHLLKSELALEDSPVQQPQRMPRPRKWKVKGRVLGKTRPRNLEGDGRHSGKRVDYVRCHHKGPCTQKTCICVQRGELCEKFCGCNHAMAQTDRLHITCNNAFRGCTCKSSAACLTNACVCFSQNRECDPDRCRTCHGCKGDAQESAKEGCCRNNGLQVQAGHRVVVGHSKIHGWGAYAVEDIAKNDIVGEYVGEVITQEEAERRGRVYDEVCYSFLFNTTIEYALDSTRLGNKLRYCNHSLTPNCEPRVMKVGGDVRVGLYAKRNIAKNEELFFNYGYNDKGPSWAMSSKQRKTQNTVGRKGAAEHTDSDDSDSLEIVPRSGYEIEAVNGLRTRGNVKKRKRSSFVASHPEDGGDVAVELKRNDTEKTSGKADKKRQATRRAGSSTKKQQESSAACEGEHTAPDRSVWRGVLKRVSVGAAEVESPCRKSRNCDSVASPGRLSDPKLSGSPRTTKRRRPASIISGQYNADAKITTGHKPGEVATGGLVETLIDKTDDIGLIEVSNTFVRSGSPVELSVSWRNGKLESPQNGSDTDRTESVDRSKMETLAEEIKAFQKPHTVRVRGGTKKRARDGTFSARLPTHKNAGVIVEVPDDSDVEFSRPLSQMREKFRVTAKTAAHNSEDNGTKHRPPILSSSSTLGGSSKAASATSAQKRLRLQVDSGKASNKGESQQKDPKRGVSIVSTDVIGVPHVDVISSRTKSSPQPPQNGRQRGRRNSIHQSIELGSNAVSGPAGKAGGGVGKPSTSPSGAIVNLVSDDDTQSNNSLQPNFQKHLSKERPQ